MQGLGEADPNTCAYNDLGPGPPRPGRRGLGQPHRSALGRSDRRRRRRHDDGERVFSSGNSSLRLGITQLSPKTGVSLGSTNSGGWSHDVYTVSPGIPGDSGSAFLDSQGRALGVLSTLQIAPLPAGNGVGDLSHELAYARNHVPALADLQVVNGTRAFNGNQLPLGL